MADVVTLDFNSALLVGATSRRKVERSYASKPSVYANVLREWLGSYLLTGLPSLGTHARLCGRQHDHNMFSFHSVFRELDGATGEARWTSDFIAPRNGLELLCNPRWVDAMVRARSTQQGQDRKSALAATDKFPRLYCRGTPFTSLAYGCHEVNTNSYAHVNLRPYLQLRSSGGTEYGTYHIENAEEGFYWENGSEVPTAKVPLKYKHGNCYPEAQTGAVYDVGVQVSLNSKNSVVGDTASVPSGDLTPCGWAVMSNTGDAGQVANFNARVARYSSQGIFSSDQRQEESVVDVYDRDFLTDYTWLSRVGDAGGDFTDDPSLGTYAYLLSELYFGGLRGAASWIDDSLDLNISFEVFGVHFASSSSFGDKRIRASLIAEWANGSRDTDLNLISHAGLLPYIRPGYAPESQITLAKLGKTVAWTRVFSEDAIDASSKILKSAVAIGNHAIELFILDSMITKLRKEGGYGEEDATPDEMMDWWDTLALTSDNKDSLYPSLLFLESSGCGKIIARSYEKDPEDGEFEFSSQHGGLDDKGLAYMDYSFDRDTRVFGTKWQRSDGRDYFDERYDRPTEAGLTLPSWDNPMAYCRWTPIAAAGPVSWEQVLQALDSTTYHSFHPFVTVMTGYRASYAPVGYWASLVDGKDAIACSWYNATGENVSAVFPHHEPVDEEKLKFSSETSVYHPVYLEGRYDVNPGEAKPHCRVNYIPGAPQLFSVGALMTPSGVPGQLLQDPAFPRLLGNIGPVQALLTAHGAYKITKADSNVIIYAFTKLWAPAIIISGEV